jgi:hypothetical protein
MLFPGWHIYFFRDILHKKGFMTAWAVDQIQVSIVLIRPTNDSRLHTGRQSLWGTNSGMLHSLVMVSTIVVVSCGHAFFLFSQRRV